MDPLNKNPRCLGVNGATSKRPATRCLNHALTDQLFCSLHLHQAATLAAHLNPPQAKAADQQAEHAELTDFLSQIERMVQRTAPIRRDLLKAVVMFAAEHLTEEEWREIGDGQIGRDR